MNDPAPKTYTWQSLHPAARRTFYFIGVTTGSSSIRRVFPLWAEHLELGDVELVGIDLAIHAPDEHYRTVVEFIKNDPLSLGALVTTHKIDLYNAAKDLFDEIDPLATLMSEVSSLSKRDGSLRADAKDPISSGLAIEAFLPQDHFTQAGTDLVIFGAGGSAVAIDWYLSDPRRAGNRPEQITVTNRSRPRLDTLEAVHRAAGRELPVRTVLADRPEINDEVLATARPGSLVINATGLGKDAPGSPLTDERRFPERAIAWDLNYRGDLLFLDQAREQQLDRRLQVEDGWIYFIHGWTQVIAEVFDVEIPVSGPDFDELSRLAGGTRR
ncbi:shikimate dehydrogenase family protein [Microlunatus soli]|uniref:Shikimate 5-dehydrogenase n=1 Tax=Microlunatus soli TaxID=630515 RepID=A0A1H1PWQ9_9ACTN|nr:shikimate dehydrogenase [Microlunatus soli]SDS15632.1 Shikimate 5-dehydrogenase [Microlunatus soli]